jgi:hypothetical protein
MILPADITRCANDNCKERLNCKRFLAYIESDMSELTWWSIFDEKDCEFKIEADEQD